MTNKNNSGLGRGIKALFDDNSLNSEELNSQNNEKDIKDIQTDQLIPNPNQPRKEFDDKSLEELSNSIKQSGIFQPIIVRKSKNNNYEILAGERRFRAAKIAGIKKIPAIIKDLSNDEMLELGIIENLQREDLSPIEEAEAYHTLMVKLGITQEEVAKRLGKSRPYIANYLRLLNLPLPIKNLLLNKKISMAQARTLVGIKDEEKLLSLGQRLKNENLTVKELESLISKSKTTHRNSPAYKMASSSPYLKEIENKLQDKFGTKVKIKKTSNKKGKIEIDYLSDQDFDRLLQILEIDGN